MMTIGRAALAGALILMYTATALGGTNVWTETGPLASDVQVRFSTSPDIAYAKGGDKLWKTTDGGQTWVTLLSDNASLTPFAVSPTDPNIVLIGYGFFSDGILRSSDGGATFTAVVQGSTQAVAFAADGDIVYATRGDLPAKILRSTDKGATWTFMASNGMPTVPGTSNLSPVPYSLAVDSANSNVVFAGLRHPDYQGIYRSTDGGVNFAPVSGLAGISVNEIVSHPFVAARKFTATNSGLFRSSDSGATWLRVTDPTSTGVATADLMSVAIDPLGTIYAGGAQHGEIFVSEDDGSSWTRRDTGVVTNRINTLAPRPAHSGELLAGTGHTLYRGKQFGQNWTASANGIRASNITSLQNGSRLRVGLADGGLYESLDGANWTPLNNAGLRAQLAGNKFSSIMEILETPNRLFVQPFDSPIVSSPNLGATWSPPGSNYPTFMLYHYGGLITLGGMPSYHLSANSYGIYRTPDDGASWYPINNGLPASAVVKLAQKADGSAIYAGTAAHGVYKSIDAGLTWTPFNNGLTSLETSTLAYDDTNDILLVGTYQGLFASRGDVASFTSLPNPWPGAQFAVNAIVVEDFVRGALYVGFQKKVFRSVDSGQHWDELGEGNPYSTSVIRITSMVSDGPGVLYLGNMAAGLDTYTVSPDISLSTSHIPAGNYVIGTKLPYQLIVTNSGPHASTFTQASFQVPSNVDVADLTASKGSCSVSGSHRLSCEFGALDSGQSAIVTLGLVGAAGGLANFSVTAGAAEIDRDPSNNSGSLSGVRFVESVDLGATLTVTPAQVNSGTAFDYTLVVTNAGPNPVTGATFETTFDARDQYVLAQGSAAGCTGTVAGVQTCPLPTIAVGGSVTYRWTVTPQWGGARAPSVVLRVDTQNCLDTNAANNTATATANVVPVTDLSATLSSPVANSLQGAPLALTATVTNNSVIDAAGVTATITLADRFTVVSASGAAGTTCTVTGNVAGCAVGALAAGASRPITINVVGARPGSSTNTVSVASLGPDPNVANNSGTVDVTVDPANDLGITLTAPASATTGATMTLTLVASNLTLTDAAGTHVDLTLSNLVTYASASGATCTSAGGTVGCDVGTISGAGSKTITITLNAVTAGSASHSATINSPATDPVSTNNAASASTTLNAPPPAGGNNNGGGGGGGGGGGSFDWLTTLLLAALIVVSCRRTRST